MIIDINDLISGFKDHLYELQTALDESQAAQEAGQCLPVEDWLRSAIAAYAQSSNPELNKKNQERPTALATEIFGGLIDQAVAAISAGRSAAEFYYSFATGENNSDPSWMLTVASGYCREQGADWENLRQALMQGDASGLPLMIASFAELLIGKKALLIQALENKNQASYDPADETLLQWYAAIFAAYCWSEAAMQAFVSREIGKYFDRWRIAGSEERFPYFMDKTIEKGKSKKDSASNRYTWYREHDAGDNSKDLNTSGGGKQEWDKTLLPMVKESEKQFRATLHTDRYILHNGQYCLLEGSTSYKKNKNGYTSKSDGQYIKLKGQEVYKSIEDVDAYFIKEGDTYRETFDFQSYGEKSYEGKGTPELMNYVVQWLRASDKMGAKVNKDYLSKFGLGIDCSGFVSQGLIAVMIALRVPVKEQLQTIGPGYGRMKTNATTLRQDGGGCKRLFSYRKGSLKIQKAAIGQFTAGLFDGDPTKDFRKALQPGDIIMSKQVTDGKEDQHPFHIFVIQEVAQDHFVVLNSSANNKFGPRTDICKPNLTEAEKAQGGYLDFAKFQTVTPHGSNQEEFYEFSRPMALVDLSRWAKNYVDMLVGQ